MDAVESAQFLQIEIREETLVLLLAQRRLRAEELRGLTPQARRQLRRLLLRSLLSGPDRDGGAGLGRARW
ncbi:hypothetical protein SAMN04487965_2010 [Microbulbifer donghaiensis]|uniref:Uncharacterized protein n=1 Tax=Microbulbifer donghaiensis TaxID=494016 RepID=A0A1M5AYJ9_9GAMM|nr:hypothetical protein [Microbulbifer donghaiensis]SHF35290.1 hypothetical protein SAMN04487965_2010 [Microbulbifer donghaiensis]